ncbi:PRC-barrel domain-containing protein [Aquabacterium sp. OR-4]|uniref:PRC-barrel domain-containing protein n=1 Tax=Aquabacterium sp. OR-4 TaxID=2978127 RepID=UPI0021B43476|nr:PRC-barrel domain-containing protein [Aquabacterium sp. OR-4]MDT7834097.1 PRC-barrel domain-containing protein [Aquabacterium sp. OR-4]
MKNVLHPISLAALALVASLGAAAPALTLVAGPTTSVDVSVTESTQLALGWSVKKTLLGKTLFNGGGSKVGKVEDLIISPDRNVSYVIVGAGGFIGIGRHDVAIPVNQIQNRAGKLVMPTATKESLKALPAFADTNGSARRDQFLAAVERDIAEGNDRVLTLEKAVDGAAAEAKLDEMKQAPAARWREFEASVSAATAKLRRNIDQTVG